MSEENIKNSIASIYSSLLNKRKEQYEAKKQQKLLEKETKEREETEDERPISKKEKRENSLNSWKTIIVGLTGDDLDYVSTNKSKKKYKKWINDDLESSGIMTTKSPKKKKKNYNKEFEPEINMLKSIVSDQNRFTVDLLKRYQNMAGPPNKDGMPLNKTLVELAAVINNSRSNSLGVLREIGNIKKTIADLYMKQRKEDREAGGEGFNTTDLGLLGSDIVRSTIFGNDIPNNTLTNSFSTPVDINNTPVATPVSIPEKFDPSTWNGTGIDIGMTAFENIPHKVIVEWHKTDNKARYLAIREDTGEELIGCPVPTAKVKNINEANMTATDDFDQIYTLKIIE